MRRFLSCLLLLITVCAGTFAQQPLVTPAGRLQLNNLSRQFAVQCRDSYQKALQLALQKHWPLIKRNKNGSTSVLQGVSSLGYPVYLQTHNNIIAAATTGTNTVQPGGVLGLNLSGSNDFLNGKLAIWDGGSVYKQHQEFAGKTITYGDASIVSDHSTHVAGTMVAKGVYAPAQGMAFNASTLTSYDFNNDVSEMSGAAAGLLLSNHSYGDEAGWNYNSTESRWEWDGLPGDTVDYTFGFYDSRAQSWDKIAYNAPYYLIVESAGNAHASTGPAVGADYYGYKSATDQEFVDKGARPANISSNSGYDVIATTGNAKNILTIGAINPLPFGPSKSSEINIAYFSSWGPTDDGRVKPDLVADGVSVLSTGIGSPTSYLTLSGTSMAAPNVTGSLYLLQEYYAQKHSGAFMRSATLKGLACHTAFDAGNAGPDYIYGWGVLDMKKAVQAMTDNGIKALIQENTLQQGATKTFNVIASGNGPLMATIAWTDPAGNPNADGTINNRTPKLINDLDIRISDGTNTYMPWVLDPANPSAAATTGNNIRDNVEQVYIAGAVPGKNYTITVSHKGTLQSGSQDYSIIITGIGGTAYCASAPLSSADSRINNLTLSNINNTPAAGCTTYSDYTGQTIQLEQAKTYALNLTLGTCGGNFAKAAKVFIDWNGNSVFDNSELVATTNVITGTGTYTTNITVPGSVTAGNFSLMRVVLQETSDTSSIKACGNYGKGETQDYRVQFQQASTDVGIVAIVSPASGGVCSGAVPVTVRVKNFGGQTVSYIPVNAKITDQNGVTTNYTGIYQSSLSSLAEDDFTFNERLNITPGSTYTVTAATQLSGDLATANDQLSATVSTPIAGQISNLSAYYCSNTQSYNLLGSGDGQLLWYQKVNDTIPIAAGTEANTTVAPLNNTYYAGLNDFTGTVGAPSKNAFSGGGYNQFTPSISVYTAVPMVVRSARIYVGYSGKITFNISNSNGQVVSTTTINAQVTRTDPEPGVQNDDPNDKGQVYDLNLLFPNAGNYTVDISYDDNATIYRSNVGVTGYPFRVGNIFSITGNTATSGNDTTYYNGYYYYLYDIKLASPGCAATARQPVTLSKPVITQNNEVLTSNFSSGNQWYYNGAVIKGATAQNYSPAQSGNYTVDVTLDNGCVAKSDVYVYSVKAKNPDNSEIGLSVFPVPVSSTPLNIAFTAPSSVQGSISLINEQGQAVYSVSQAIPSGNFSTTLSVSRYPAGTYILKITLGDKSYRRKIIVEH